ncbi:ribbon-helix-helix domain-containing protein [Pelagibacterium lentulum]|uniref:Ribbon-helix-helix domain-containing protein n=1 Tax=Pelagibacterium lentulum TaxID=2029865 RepID=A0A916R9N9_9HYPH|nr:ribbon-helix-helix domain-containing protein [Pelagibacterium lentulum]GGA47920.1 hypothetical protein GCM10011499_17220 [Pelagibacterium lentulum]
MCRLFIGADPELWDVQTRSMRIDGVSTSVRLENFFWSALEEIGKRDGLSLAQLMTRLYSEALEEGHNVDNFASFLRVCCGRYLALQLEGEIPLDSNIPIRSLDADTILSRERNRRTASIARLSA